MVCESHVSLKKGEISQNMPELVGLETGWVKTCHFGIGVIAEHPSTAPAIWLLGCQGFDPHFKCENYAKWLNCGMIRNGQSNIGPL